MDLYNWTLKKRQEIRKQIELSPCDHDDNLYETLILQWEQLATWQRNISTMALTVYQRVMLELLTPEEAFSNSLGIHDQQI